ncbi:hypothetical protein GOODEAATRI_026805 [Goodea atripinnis]|uniref:Uncharacterized protein n=1 Tax=Goodea atripinnis TaxID=208336 RepID=A0ABV0Q2A6_9TELE
MTNSYHLIDHLGRAWDLPALQVPCYWAPTEYSALQKYSPLFSCFVASQPGVKMDCLRVCTISFTEHAYNFEYFFYCEANSKWDKITENFSMHNCSLPKLSAL